MRRKKKIMKLENRNKIYSAGQDEEPSMLDIKHKRSFSLKTYLLSRSMFFNLIALLCFLFCILMGTGIGIGLYFVFDAAESAQITRALEDDSSQRIAAFRQSLTNMKQQTKNLVALMSNPSSSNMTFEEFLTYNKISGSDIVGLYMLEWCPIVWRHERSDFEMRARQIYAPHISDFHIKEPNFTHGGWEVSPDHELFAPILFYYPYDRDSQIPIFGYDVLSVVNYEMMSLDGFSLYDGEARGQARWKLVEDEGTNIYSIMFNFAVYKQVKNDSFTDTPKVPFTEMGHNASTSGWNGIIYAIFKLSLVMDELYPDINQTMIAKLFDITPGINRDEKFLHSTIEDDYERSQDYHDSFAEGAKFKYKESIYFTDRVYEMIFFPLDTFISRHSSPIKYVILVTCVVISLLLGVAIIFLVKRIESGIKMKELAQERMKLLKRILPSRIVDRIMKGENVIAEDQVNISISFMDIVGFTTMCTRSSAQQVIIFLNDLFSEMDTYCSKYDLEKIKTIGDCYFVASKSSSEELEYRKHAKSMGLFCLRIISVVHRFSLTGDSGINVRIGIHFGSVVAGVIGKSKPYYDLWGDDVNTASRMESTGIPGKIQVSESYYKVTSEFFKFEHRGEISVKGKGQMKTYILNDSAQIEEVATTLQSQE